MSTSHHFLRIPSVILVGQTCRFALPQRWVPGVQSTSLGRGILPMNLVGRFHSVPDISRLPEGMSGTRWNASLPLGEMLKDAIALETRRWPLVWRQARVVRCESESQTRALALVGQRVASPRCCGRLWEPISRGRGRFCSFDGARINRHVVNGPGRDRESYQHYSLFPFLTAQETWRSA